MKFRRTPLIGALSILFTLLASNVCRAKEIRVALMVDASDNIKAEILRAISQELRKFEDVVISFDNFDYQMSVVALMKACGGELTQDEKDGQESLKTGNGGPLYIFSLVVAKSPPGVRANPKQFAAILGHTVQTDERLEVLCKYVATETNAHVFEPERKLRNLGK